MKQGSLFEKASLAHALSLIASYKRLSKGVQILRTSRIASKVRWVFGKKQREIQDKGLGLCYHPGLGLVVESMDLLLCPSTVILMQAIQGLLR